MKQPLVSIVILNWNGIDDTEQCLESIKRLNYSSFEVIVVDNGSVDGSLERLKKINNITLIPLPKNTGFTGGHIEGLQHANGEYIALLNNDLVVHQDWLNELMHCAIENNADIVGGKSYTWNDQDKAYDESNPYSSYQTVSPVTGHTAMLKSANRLTEANNLSGSNLLVSKKVIEHIGYLDDSFFAYYEETDFIARAKRAGFKASYCPTAKVWHKSGASSKSIPFFYFYQMHRNRFRFAFKNYDSPELRKFLKYYTKEMLGATRTNRRNPNLHDKAMVKAYFNNIAHLPELTAKRMTVQRLGDTYSKKLVAATEGFDDVTVVVPCYNYAEYIVETLNSLEEQSLKPVEVIIINDGSTDNSSEVIRNYIKNANQTSDISYGFIDKKNEGVIATKNMALDLVETNWMLFLDADDTLNRDYIFECVKRARQDNSDVVYTDMQMFGATDTLQKVTGYNKRLLRSVNFVHNSALMRTAVFKQAGGYKKQMAIGFEDWELYLTISEITDRFSYIAKPLLNYRRHEGASRDSSAQNKLPQVVKTLERLHPTLYSMSFFWWLELYQAKNHVKALLKLPINLAIHTKSHTVKHAIGNPDSIAGKSINAVRKKVKGNGSTK